MKKSFCKKPAEGAGIIRSGKLRSKYLLCLLCAALLVCVFSLNAQGAEPETPVREAETVTAESEVFVSEEQPKDAQKVSQVLNTDTHKAYMNGHDNIFCPDSNVTRAEAAQMFYSLLRDTKIDEAPEFTDVTGQWYTTAIETLAAKDIIHGYDDGSFKPNKSITRAEFVAIAVGCDTLDDTTETEFNDVPENAWFAKAVSTAYNRGWISGNGDGTFKPNDRITRAEAVVILNRVLGRRPSADLMELTEVRNFYDVFPDHWAYTHIVEASTTHNFRSYSDKETWTNYDHDRDMPEESGWVTDGGTKYYLDAETGKFLRGTQTIDGKEYKLSSTTGAAYTGFQKIGKWKRYYKNGVIIDDISGENVVKGPYFIKVYKDSNYLIVFARDKSGEYNIPVRAMRASCGYSTITGTYYTPSKYRWLRMIGYTWAQWCTQVSGNYLIHSVPNWSQSNNDLEVEEYNHLGETRSLGCIRLNCRDAKWIYDNCDLGTKVTITTAETKGPLSKPAGIKIPSWHTWDPTDPTAKWRCKEKGCKH